MRRSARAMLASLSILSLAGCGSATGGGSPSVIVFTNGSSAYQSVFTVAPAATTPLLVTAVGIKSNTAIVQPGMTVTWNAAYTSGTFQNPNNSTGVTSQTACPAVPPATANPATGALVMQIGPTGAYSTYVAGTPTNTIGILPSNLATPAATAPAVAANGVSYCLNVIATANNGTVGTFIVAVTN